VNLTNRKGRPITSLDDWASLGKPASAVHWKPGRSAYELARDWTERDAEQAVVALLSSRPEFVGIQLLDGVAEKQTRFDDCPHGPRNHDLLVRARLCNGQTVTVGIEAKADEEFDVPLWRYREKGVQRSKDTAALRRIDWMVRRWFQTSLRADRAEPPLICMGYQLFSALAGTLADAKAAGSRQAVVLTSSTSPTGPTTPSTRTTPASLTAFWRGCSAAERSGRKRRSGGSLRRSRLAETGSGRPIAPTSLSESSSGIAGQAPEDAARLTQAGLTPDLGARVRSARGSLAVADVQQRRGRIAKGRVFAVYYSGGVIRRTCTALVGAESLVPGALTEMAVGNASA
jgi:hypothetical protein